MRDFTVEQTKIPIQIIGLQKNDVDTRKAELKFSKSLEALALVHPNIFEARAVVKTSLLEKERRRYEVKVVIKLPREQFDLSADGWSIEETFEHIAVKMKRLRTKPRDRSAYRRRHSRAEIERERFAE